MPGAADTTARRAATSSRGAARLSVLRGRTINVAVVDPHTAVRLGVSALLDAEPGFAAAGAVDDEAALWPLLNRARPSVVLIADEPGSPSGLLLCLRIKATVMITRVVLYSARANSAIVAAHLAGADALIDKTAEPRELLRVIRAVMEGDDVMLPIVPSLQTEAARRLDPQARAILAMRLAGTKPKDIAATVGLDLRALRDRTMGMIAALAGAGTAGDQDVVADPAYTDHRGLSSSSGW